MKSVKKVFVMFTVIFTLVMTIIPPSFAMGVLQDITTKGDTPANWPEGFAPYTNSSGVPIFDPGSDVHPIDVDITSGVDRGIGNLPSMYVASDDTNFFVRLRLKGNPYDRKGGFLSSVWFVKVAVNGEAKATIGLDGKSPHTDYIYIANADGTNVQPIYKTTADGSTVPGTRITPAENGHYFLDFQVPISRITDMVPSITASTPVQFFFGSSKAANLSVINKDWMNPSDGTGNTEDYSGLASVSLNTQYLTLSIDGGNSKQYSTTNNKVTGRSSLASGTVSLVVNNTPAVSVPISNHSWSYDLPSSITANNGIYKAAATVTESGKNSAATQDIMILDNSDTLLINGGANAITNSKTPVLSGIYAGSHSNNVRIRVYIDGNEITPNTGADRNTTNLTWTQSANLVSPYDGKPFSVRVDWTDTGNKATLFATATQQLTYKEGITLSPVSVNISPITGDAKPVISGTSGGSDKVEVQVDGKTVEIAQPDSSGNWKVLALEQPLSIGNHIVTAIVRNSAGNTAIDSEPYTVSGSAITIDNGLTTASNDPAPTIRGNTNATDGSKVTITIDNSSKYEAIVKNGRWEIQVPNNTPLFEGIHTVAAAVNNVSASQQLTIDMTTNVEILTPDSTTKDGRPLFSGTAESGATVELLVTEESGQLVFVKNLQADVDGKWQFTPAAEILKGSYQIMVTASDLNGNDAEKTSTFTIIEAAVSITKIDNITRVVDYGTNLDDAVKALGSEVIVYLQDGKTAKVGIIWSKTAEPEYKGDTPGSYVFKGALGMLPVGVENNNLIPAPTGTVTVKEKPTVSIKSVTPVQATVANGTTLEAAKSALGSKVTVTLENGVTADVPITWSPNSTPAYDGTTAGNYVFTGTFGPLASTIDNLRGVAAPSGTVEVLTPQTVSIESVSPITKIVPIGTGIDEAKKALGEMVTVNLAGGGPIDIPVTWSEGSVPNYDGHNRGEYVFDGTFGPLPTGVDNHNQVAPPKGTVKIYSNAADITAFSFAEETKPAQINAVDKTILAEVKNGTSLEQLKASFTLSQYARGANISEDSQVSGKTANNFSTPVTYTVIAEDGTKQDWVITVVKQAKTAAPDVTSTVRAGNQLINGTSEPGAVISVKRDDGVLGTTTANDTGNWSIELNNGVMISKGDILNFTAEVFGKAASDARQVIVFSAVQLVLEANPSSIVGDGISTAVLTAVLKDLEGNPIPNVEVNFKTELGTLSASKAITDDKGRALVTLLSPKVEGTEPLEKTVTASVADAARGVYAEDDITIHFHPPIIKGQVLDAKGNPITNARVWIETESGKIEVTTDSQGNYSITVPRSGDYYVNIQAVSMINGEEVTSIFTQKAQVQASGQSEEYKSEPKVSGQLFVGTRNKQIKSLKEMFPNAQINVSVLNDPTGNVQASIDSEGKYELTGFELSKTYEVVFNIVVNGDRLAGKLAEVTVGTDGQMIIQNELIDPFGLIKDSVTGQLLPGVNLKLYWADTALNKGNGRIPNTLVQLPELPNFHPNKNNNPQLSTDMLDNTEQVGNYAWMVFANGDYYIIGEKDGYVTFDSRTDLKTNNTLGDSWVKDGIIHIGQTMMRYDFSMDRVAALPSDTDGNGSIPSNPSGLDGNNSNTPAPTNTGENSTAATSSTADEADTLNAKQQSAEPKTQKESKVLPTGLSLPKTATNMYNAIFLGFLIIGLGILLFYKSFRKKDQI